MRKIFSVFLCFIILLSVFSESALPILAVEDSDGNQDTYVREEYDYYKNDFTSVSGTDLVIPDGLSSSTSKGALGVEPADTNKWDLNPDVELPDQIIISFKLMVPESFDKNDNIKLFYDMAISDYLINIRDSQDNVVASMNVGSDLVGFRMMHNNWYNVTIVMTTTTTIVYFENSFLGSIKSKISEQGGEDCFFAFNKDANDSSKPYYIDDLLVSTVADESFIKLVAYQKTDVVEEKYNVRFLAILGGIFECEELVGFKIFSHTNQKEWDLHTRTVYNYITADFGEKIMSASEFGGKHLSIGYILKIPEVMKTVEFVVTPYVKIMDVNVYASSVTVVINIA